MGNREKSLETRKINISFGKFYIAFRVIQVFDTNISEPLLDGSILFHNNLALSVLLTSFDGGMSEKG